MSTKSNNNIWMPSDEDISDCGVILLSKNSFEELITQTQLCMTESDVAIEVIANCFIRIYAAANKLIASEKLDEADRKFVEQMVNDVPEIMSALQFQDRLNQRLELIKSMILESELVDDRGENKKIRQERKNRLAQERINALSLNTVGKQEFILFSDAA